MKKQNWDDKITEIESCLKTWSRRNLTLFGKVQIIKSLAISKIVLSATLLSVPDGIIEKLNKVFSNIFGGIQIK